MKVWIKDKRYAYKQEGNLFKVYFNGKEFAKVFTEYDARKSIWVHLGRKDGVFVSKSDFEDWGDNDFVYPEKKYTSNRAIELNENNFGCNRFERREDD